MENSLGIMSSISHKHFKLILWATDIRWAIGWEMVSCDIHVNNPNIYPNWPCELPIGLMFWVVSPTGPLLRLRNDL